MTLEDRLRRAARLIEAGYTFDDVGLLVEAADVLSIAKIVAQGIVWNQDPRKHKDDVLDRLR